MSTTTTWSDDHFIAGDVALDFANTVYRRTPEIGADLIDSVDALIAWLHYAELLPTLGDTRDYVDDPPAALREAHDIRGLFWVIFEAQAVGRELPADALAGLFDVARLGISNDVTIGPDGSVTPRTTRGALTVVALHGVRAALNPWSPPVRTCDRCGWFFIDTSRGRRRRWCSMKTCGNQAKAARYRSSRP
ncbi:CGNR zinc finger domain-containing protein [Phytoactinopolyspora limicola]|uniref:CGNR zinc finger domain-containing protein n=1 Tax=Phytoactinopolyspora limicola TaxID=2715536 RepID=UPI00140D91B1|nr:CGNR zinc finger domain-containing protein [Phytoactinopolyspora limicola]